MRMKQDLRALAPYLAALGADFYLLPLLGRNTGAAMLLMLCVMPFLAFLTGVVHGLCRGFSLWLALLALLLFLPAIPLYYNYTAWVYAPVYAAILLAGLGLGRLFHGRK